LYDLTPEGLGAWVNPLPAAGPLRVFTTPHHIPNDAYFAHVNQKAGLTLDRGRIARLAEAEHIRDCIRERMKDSYEDLVSLVVNGH
jgi:hypothetical protein